MQLVILQMSMFVEEQPDLISYMVRCCSKENNTSVQNILYKDNCYEFANVRPCS